MSMSPPEPIDFDGIQGELRILAEAHGMIPKSPKNGTAVDSDHFMEDELIPSKRWKHKLERRHVALEFDPPELVADEIDQENDHPGASTASSSTRNLFYAFARAVCQSGRVPRKELFETWAMALYVHQAFPDARRIADLASGHGLLSWALLVLAHYHQRPDRPTVFPKGEEGADDVRLSVVCVDRARPIAVGMIRSAMLDEWPDLKDYWDFVKGPIEGVISDKSTVLVGIHACATLTDAILERAMSGESPSPVALVPCCHSRASLTDDQKELYEEEHASSKAKRKASRARSNEGVENEKLNGEFSFAFGFLNLGEFIDQQRSLRLEEAGYTVQRARIPKVFTPKNGILVAKPLLDSLPGGDFRDPKLKLTLRKKPTTMKIPVANTPSARHEVRRLASIGALA